MTHTDELVGWLKGFFDAKKNDVSRSDIRKIRKKLDEYSVAPPVVMIHDSPTGYDLLQNNPPVDPEFLAAIADKKDATSMDELA